MHGTGTPLGDPIEMRALTGGLAQKSGDPCAIALLSSKSCYGHTEGTAGLTGQFSSSLHINLATLKLLLRK